MEWIWHPSIPKKMSVLIWKIMYGYLSMDDRIKRVGINLVSKCDCCASGAYEDQNHVLASGDFFVQLWNRCNSYFGMSLQLGNSWKEKVE